MKHNIDMRLILNFMKGLTLRPSTNNDSDVNSLPSKRELRFAATVEVWEYQVDLSATRSLCYSASDYKHFKVQRKNDAFWMNGRHLRDIDIDKETKCVRGLEKLIFPALAKQSSDTMAEVRRAVLVGQRHCDPDSISRASIFHSQQSVKMARDNALNREERKRRKQRYEQNKTIVKREKREINEGKWGRNNGRKQKKRKP
mmetsp:Transcript_15142/g.27040  ORF Transcript_15142/g.27040 Transcript_15142/m.27040 type:complete len:200 (-) Transcript_15142:158-757(-)